MENDIGLVLIHGAGLGSFIWNDLKPHLGCPTLAYDFPHRNQVAGITKHLRFSEYLDPLVAAITSWPTEKFVIVAHSIGGILGLEAAKYFPDRIAGFVGISASLPRRGKSFLSCLPFPRNMIIRFLISTIGTRPPEHEIVRNMCNDLNDEDTEAVISQFTPESANLFTHRLKAGIPAVQSMYIKLGQDQEFSNDLQHQMADNLRAKKVITLDAGHLPMMSRPILLSEALKEFIKTC